MLQTACIKHQKIPKKSKLIIEFLISLQYKNLNWKTMFKVDMSSNINCISLGTFQRLFPHQQLTKSTVLLENCSSPVSIIDKFKAFIQWRGKVSAKNFMLQMQIHHPFFYPEMLLSNWKYYRLFSLLPEKRFHHEQNKVTTVLNQVWASHHLQCLPLLHEVWASQHLIYLPLFWKVWASHHLPKRRYWRYMQMSSMV